MSTHRVTEPLPKAGHRRDKCGCGGTKDARSLRCRTCATTRPEFADLDTAYAWIAAQTSRLEADLWASVYAAMRGTAD